MELNGVAYLDVALFQNCIVDILYDLKRMKDFHEVKRISPERQMSYAAGWIIKRKPFQMIEGYEKHGVNPKYSYINEKVAFALIAKAIGLKDSKWRAVGEDRKKAVYLLNRLLYHLRFRNTSPKTIELLIYGIELGTHLEKCEG